MQLSRRTFMRKTGGITAVSLVGGPLILGSATPAWAADEYDTLRQRWAGFIIGSGYDPAAQPFADRLATQAALADQYRTSITASGNALWADLPLGTVSANVTSTFSRLRTMAQAWAMPGTSQTGNATLLAAVKSGLDYAVANGYTATGSAYNNWWDWQIGSPQSLLGTMCLVFPQLTSTQVNTYLAAVDHYVPDSKVSSYSGTSTGANRVDLCQVLALRGVLGRSSAKITLARNALSPVFPLVTTGDGFYADGSFIQHTVVPYTGSYGAVLLGGLAGLFALLAGSSWAVTDPDRQLILDTVEKSYAPFLFNGLIMDGVAGRAISRGLSTSDPLHLQADDHRRGHGITLSILRLADAASSTERARWRGLVKGWLQRDYWSPPLSDQTVSVAGLAMAQALLADASVTPLAEPVRSQVFGSMDRAVHRRADWALSISMCSTRTTFYEWGNGENVRGWHTNNGMTYWWGSTYGNGQYSDAFWPTVDPYRLPGTTVSRKVLADGAGPAWGGLVPGNNWAGGAGDGEYSLVGQYCQGAQSTLLGKKSWVCLDDAVICLGAGISSTDGVAAETTVDNRNLGGGTGTQGFSVNGVAQPTTMGWSATLAGTNWTYLSGFGGYVFPGGATVKAVREARTGTWHDINGGGTTDPITRKYLTLWYDHGVNPTNGGYQYVLMPGATSAATQARSADAGYLTVLANTRYQQGVSVPSRGVTAVNFWEIPTAALGGLSVDQPAAVLVRVTGNSAVICLADPRQNVSTVTLTWQHATTTVVSADPTVTVLGTGSQLVARFNTAGSAGRTHQLKVSW